MRIVIDMQGAQTESRFRGIGRYTLSLARAIVSNRGEHEIILALSGLFPDTIEPIRAAFDNLLPQENIRVWYAPGPVFEEQPGNSTRRDVAELLREGFLASLAPDVIHISSLLEGYVDDAVTSIGRLERSARVSVTLYDLIPMLNADHYLESNPRFARYYERKMEYFKQADVFLSISEFARQEGVANLNVSEKSVVNISTAIEARFRPLRIEETDKDLILRKFGIIRPFIFCTGGADKRKNLDRLIKAFAALPAALRANHQLVFAGKMSDENHAELNQSANSARLKPGELCFTGYVTDGELIQLYNLCKLFVFPSWHEGFGLPALEAMACGAPVIGANTSSLPEVIGLDAALFDPFDVFDISGKISQALNDNAFRAILNDNGLQQVKRFSWDESAKRAIKAWESLTKSLSQPQPLQARLPDNHKPRLAFISPLPPEHSGIADYSAELLPALSDHYEIEVIVAQDQVDGDWINRNCMVRDVSWLRAHADDYDRVVYQVGNSPFHKHMLPLMQEIPGIVVLHDFYLSGLMAWLELNAHGSTPWTDSLFTSHGYWAVRERFLDIEEGKRKYPSNFFVLRHARGIIVHSEYSRKLAQKWYGANCADSWQVIPLLRSAAGIYEKATARKKLDIDDDDFVVCSFGHVDSAKLNHRLLDAWIGSALGADKRCRLFFVGENHGGDYGANLLQTIRKKGLSKRIHITGYESSRRFRQYLMAADLAVQLRTNSRGETSASVLDCMNHALPLISNANGSMAELDSEAVWMLPDEFDQIELIKALETIWRETERGRIMGKRAQEIVRTRHSPAVCAKQYKEAVERFYHRSEIKTSTLIRSIVDQKQFVPTDSELLDYSKAIARNLPLPLPAKRFFLDVSATCRNDLKTGIERVTRALLLALLEAPPEGYRVEPVYICEKGGDWHYRSARRYTLGLLGCSSDTLNDEIVDPENGDRLISLDLSGDMLVQAERAKLISNYRNLGVLVYSVVFDLLPVRMPNVFPPGTDCIHEQWLQAISTFDGAICISKAVADDLIMWQEQAGIDWKDRRPFKIGWFHLGADVNSSAPSLGLPDDAERTLGQLQARPTFLMVGTIEPRKAYLQAIDAFSQLWGDGIDVNLVIVGKEGWRGMQDNMRRDIPTTISKLRIHPEFNNRLFWLEGISDEYLEKVYSTSICLIAASYGEGFGLPLIEAAQHKLPIIARDIPVFREVAGEYASYFTESDAQGLSHMIRDWLEKWQSKSISGSKAINFLNWKHAARVLIDVLFGGKWHYYQVSKKVREKGRDEHLDLIHRARINMVTNLLPPGDVILDLGGANCPLYKMGYRHSFKKMYLVDLPPEARHDMYKDVTIDRDCEFGEVIVHYGNMTELEGFSNESIDLVWAGQSIEHITYEEGTKLCQAVFRVLKRGGAFCLDTPNRLLTEIHTNNIGGGFIHPEHCIEYYPPQLKLLLNRAGFEIIKEYGICEMPNTLASGIFCYEDFIYGRQLTDEVDKGYIQFFYCMKP